MDSGIFVQCIMGTVILLSPIVRAEFEASFKRVLDMAVTDRCRAVGYADSSNPSAVERALAVGNAFCRAMHELLEEAPDYEQNDCLNGTDPECTDFTGFASIAGKNKRPKYRCAVTVPGLVYGTRKVSIHSCVKGSLIQYRKDQETAYTDLKRKRAIQDSVEAASNLKANEYYETKSGFKGQAPAATFRLGRSFGGPVAAVTPAARMAPVTPGARVAPVASPPRSTTWKRPRVTISTDSPETSTFSATSPETTSSNETGTTTSSARSRDGMRRVYDEVDEILGRAQREVEKNKRKRTSTSRSTTKSNKTWGSWIK